MDSVGPNGATTSHLDVPWSVGAREMGRHLSLHPKGVTSLETWYSLLAGIDTVPRPLALRFSLYRLASELASIGGKTKDSKSRRFTVFIYMYTELRIYLLV